MPRKKTSAREIAAQKRATLNDKTRQSTESVLAKIESGQLVDDCVSDMRKFGKNEFGDVLRWDEPGFEEVVRLVSDLRVARKYVSGAAQRYKGHPNTDYIHMATGYKKVGDVQVGDYFIAIDGKPTKVTGVHPLGKSETFKVSFKDGTCCVVTDEHLWTWYMPKLHSKAKLKGAPLPYNTTTTRVLYEHSQQYGGFRQNHKSKPGGYRYAIPMLESPALIDNGWDCEGIDPYLLGLLIGDGSYGVYDDTYKGCSLAAAPKDFEFYQEVLPYLTNQKAKFSHGVPGMKETLSSLGILGQTGQKKRIPEKCFSMNWEMRLELLRGLMDADGSIAKTNNTVKGARFSNSVKEIAEGVATLVRSLGGYARVSGKPRRGAVEYTVRVNMELNPFKLPRKADIYGQSTRTERKYITNIEPWYSDDCTCFTVEHPSSLYLLYENIITHNTAVCAQVNSYMSQRAGLRGLWSFPKARTLELLVPSQHKNLMRNWAKVSGVTKITRDMLTSNTQFDVGLGKAMYTHVNSQEGNAAAGTSVVAVTADYVFAEEASQSSHQEILPLYRRVDASRISSRPVTWLGTPGGGGGIEAKIADCTYEFWPHAKCPHCDHHVSLHPLGALLRSKTARAEDGTLITMWAHEDGTPLDWFHHDPLDPIGSAFVGCIECGKELSDESRIAAKYKCIRTGLFMMEFLNEVVPEVWQEEQLEVGVWVGALARPRKGIAKEIMLEMNPEGIDDWYQQRLGIPSSAMANSIPKEALMNACMRTPFTPSKEEKTIRLLGIDQGRSAWYGAVVEFVYNPNLPPAAMYHSAKRNILALECFPSMATGEFVEKFEVEGGIIDNEPSIAAAAAICRATGLKLGDQQAKIKDDYNIKLAKDGGEQFECFSLKYKKYFRFIFSLFAGSSVSVRREYLRFSSGKVKAPGDIFKHLCRIEWDAENGDVVKAKDGVDDLAFALMFAEAAFGIYTVNPGIISRESYSWDWMNGW